MFAVCTIGGEGAARVAGKAHAFSAFDQAKVTIWAVANAAAGLAADAEFFFGAPSDASACADQIPFARKVVIAGATEFFRDQAAISSALVRWRLYGAIGVAQTTDQKSDALGGLILMLVGGDHDKAALSSAVERDGCLDFCLKGIGGEGGFLKEQVVEALAFFVFEVKGDGSEAGFVACAGLKADASEVGSVGLGGDDLDGGWFGVERDLE